MKGGFILMLFLSVSIVTLSQNRFWVAGSAGNWNDPANWSTISGGAGGASVPGAANTAIFNANGLGNCTLDIAPTVAALTVNGYTGTIDLNGNTLITTGANTLASGTFINSGGPAFLTLNSTGTTTFNGTQFDVDINGSTAGLNFSGSVFNGTVNITKTDNANYNGAGGNTFNNTLNLTILGGGDLRLGNTNPDTFNSTVTLNISGTGSISLARTGAGTLFNGNLIFNYNSGGTIFIGANGGTSTLADTRTITVNCAGTGCDDLQLANFTQIGTTAQTLTLSGTGNARLTIGPNSVFNAPLNFTSEELVFNSSTFNNTVAFTQTGTNSIGSRGGNIFSAVTISNTGAGDIHLGTNAADAGDIFNGDAVFNNSGGGRIRIGSNTAGNTFFANLTLNNSSVTDVANRIQISRITGASTTIHGTTTINNTGNGSDIHISYDAGTTTTFLGDVILNQNTSNSGQVFIANLGDVTFSGNLDITNTSGDNIEISSGTGTVTFGNGAITVNTFAAGILRFQNFTQTGSTAQAIALTGTAALYLGPSSLFEGDVNFVAPQVFLNGTTYNGTTYIEKNGATNNVSTGGNQFNGTTSVVLTGSGYILTGNSSPDIFNGPLTITNTGSNFIYLAHNTPGNQFNNSITFNNTSTSGIVFCNNAPATATLTNATMALGGGGFSSGSLRLIRFTQSGGAFAQSLTLTGTAALHCGPSSSFDGNVTFIAPQILLNGATYNGITYIEKTGATANTGTGNNVFNGTTTLVNSSSADFRTNGNNSFVGTTEFINSGSQDMLFEAVSGSTYNDVTFTNTGSSYIRVAYNGASIFNGNIVVNNPTGIGVYFCETVTATATLADTKTITIGAGGFNVGELRLSRFTQVGPTPQLLTLAGTALLRSGPSSSFGGNVTFISPRLLLNGAQYNGTAYLEKTSVTGDDGLGGNIFNDITEIVNSGDAYLLTGSTSPDTFNDLLIISNLGASTIRLADNSAGNQFNGNIELNSTFGGGIYFGNNVSGTSTLAAGRTIGVGSSGVISGNIRLIRFTQVGPTAQTLDLSGIAILTLGPSSSFGGDVDFRSPQLLLNGTTFSGTAYLEKKGATNNAGNGGNIFNSTTTISNSGSGYLLTANTNPDIFNGDLTVTNTGSNIIYLAHNVTGSQFNGNITFNSTLGSGGIYFANNATADASLGNGASLLVGGLGFSSGELRFRRFTQIGSADQTLVLTGTALLRLGPSSTFNGNIDYRSPQFALDGCTFNGITYLEKTGALNNDSNGGNSFNGVTTIANSGSGFFRFALTGLDTFNGDLTLTNTGAGSIRMADNVPGTTFNGNIIVNSTAGAGIFFSESGGGTATLANGRTISVGGSGFSIGDLRIRRFTQLGTSAQTLLLTGTARLLLGTNVTFNGQVDFRAPQVFLQGGTYNNTAHIQKTGATDNTSNGGNTFNGITTISNSGSGQFTLADISPDIFNAALNASNTGTSWLRFADNSAGNQFNGSVTFNCTSGNGIIIGNSAGGFATLAAGQTFTIIAFSAGELRLRRVTQVGSTAQTMTLTGNANLRIGGSTTFNGNVTFVSPQVELEGGIFNGSASITKSGATNNDNTGGNTFNGTTTLTNSSTARWRLSVTNPDTYSGAVTFVKSSSGAFEPAYNATNSFSSNITFNSNTVLTLNLGTGVTDFTGSNAQTISKTGGTPSPVIRRVSTNKTAQQIILATDLTISSGALLNSGVINTDPINFLNFADNATVVGANDASYVAGPVRKTGDDSFSFPVGDNGFYRPISISAPTTTTHAFTAQYFNQNHLLGSPAVWDPSFWTVSGCEYWTLDRTTGASNVFVTLSWNESACNPGYITFLPDLRVTRWNGTNWVNHGNGGTTGSGTNGTILTSAAVTNFSPFTLASVSALNPLPVELTYFRASLTPEKLVNLEWQTASELNNDAFEVERSKDGFDFTSVARVNGAGTTTGKTDYSIIDEAPLPGISYYRLKQIDFDGTYTYSHVVSVKRGEDPFIVYPNPAGKQWVTFNRKVTAAVINNLNQIVGNYTEAEGFDTSALAPGLYIVRTHNGEIFKLIIQ